MNPIASPHVMPTYGRLPIALSHGQGCKVWDTDGQVYLDAIAGIAVNTLGHAHPVLTAALREQVGQLIHTSNYYHIPWQEEAARRLCQLSGLRNAFFCNSGLEANEAALKIARRFGHDRGISHPKVLVFDRAFHGRSLATLAATGNVKVQQGFGPLMEGFVRIPYDDLAALEDAFDEHPDLVAIFLEPIQGEGGIRSASVDFLQAIRRWCNSHDCLLMLDEVQCGVGRTGRWFAHQWADIEPDVMSLAKGLGSGVPVGAVLCGPKASGLLKAGHHGSTFGGNPLAMRAVATTLQVMEDEQLLQRAQTMGRFLLDGLRQKLSDVAGVSDIRGQGLMIGVELERPCSELFALCAQAGLLVSITADHVIRLVPPLILSESEACEIIDKLVPVVRSFLSTP